MSRINDISLQLTSFLITDYCAEYFLGYQLFGRFLLKNYESLVKTAIKFPPSNDILIDYFFQL